MFDLCNFSDISQLANNTLDITDKNRKLKNYQIFDLHYGNGRWHFDKDESHNYLIFLPIHNAFKRPAGDTESMFACLEPWK